jgi:hypothetical protein|tara:strand:- start:1794 stop:2876 length:1083 start_codon:yes stop_codon:yes gene_type:complete
MNKTLKSRKKRLIDALSIQTSSGKEEAMIKYIISFCLKNAPSAKIEVLNNNVYITKGESEIYPCIVAHTDTVHDIHKFYKVFDNDNCLFAFNAEKGIQVGVGGDDKVGVWLALEMLRRQEFVKCVFFHSEEIGCVGSRDANMSWFNNVAYCLQGDRRGNKDFVNSISGKLYSDSFAEDILPIISKYGYAETTGSITDVGQLAENGIGVAVANMSCGYYAPHSDSEIVEFLDANNCLDMIINIVDSLPCVRYEHKYQDEYSFNHWGDFKGASKNFWYDDAQEVIVDGDGNETCYYCQGELRESSFGDEFRYCGDCCSDVMCKTEEVEYSQFEDVSDNYDGSMEHRDIVNSYLNKTPYYKNK